MYRNNVLNYVGRKNYGVSNYNMSIFNQITKHVVENSCCVSEHEQLEVQNDKTHPVDKYIMT